MNLVTLQDGIPFASHREIANFIQAKETAILDLITRNKIDFEEFGQLRFENGTVKNSVGAVNQTKTYYLNEQQSSLLFTYLRNSPIVKELKKELIRAFWKLKEQVTTDPMRLIAQTLETLVSQQTIMMKFLERKVTEQDAFSYVDKPTSRLALRRLSNEEKFIAKTRKVLKECDGLSQGELLIALGRNKADRTALRWLHGYDGIYWRANIIGAIRQTYSYSIIEGV